MRLKIRCDGECEKFYKIFWQLNKALASAERQPRPSREAGVEGVVVSGEKKR